jgi:hypothetical protein
MPRRGGVTSQVEWTRAKLLATLAGAVAAVLLLVAGLGLAFYFAITPASTGPAAVSNHAGHHSVVGLGRRGSGGLMATIRHHEDRLANRAMPHVGLQAAEPGRLSTQVPGTIVLPRATTIGVAGVPTGFPHTAAGALAQLAGIDQTALQSASVAATQTLITQWAATGGPTPQSWSGVKAVAQMLSALGLPSAGSRDLAVMADPLMGQIKGTVGSDFVVVCVDFEVQATLNQTARVAAADCQRMVWQGYRWVIGPGSEPAQPPSVWPGTAISIAVGYEELRYG